MLLKINRQPVATTFPSPQILFSAADRLGIRPNFSFFTPDLVSTSPWKWFAHLASSDRRDLQAALQGVLVRHAFLFSSSSGLFRRFLPSGGADRSGRVRAFFALVSPDTIHEELHRFFDLTPIASQAASQSTPSLVTPLSSQPALVQLMLSNGLAIDQLTPKTLRLANLPPIEPTTRRPLTLHGSVS
ncbi:hypothetical protein BX666DRAFT_1879975 [Dichotomocladium elegans]|nr:hypothetical protein BX666DRAFT_1879975 [Dichotomocladium elegans]